MSIGIIILIVIVLGALTIKRLQPTFFYPSPGPIPDRVNEEVVQTLYRFGASLERYAPDVLSALQPGLSENMVREIEARYKLPLTDDLRALYQWRNGSAPDARAELIPGHWFSPLEHAAQAREEVRSQLAGVNMAQRIGFRVFAGHRTGWLVLLDDGAGDGYFYDPGRRRHSGSFFYHFAEIGTYRFFPSLGNFLTGAIECYEKGIYRAGQRWLKEDHERVYEVWNRYASSPG